ncbi:MAG: hypothetical protein ACEQSB_07770 [Undibacterium sp.]
MALDVESVCRILKTCHESGVSELTFAGLKVKFGVPATASEEMLAPVSPVVAHEIEAEAIAQAESRIREDQLANLPLENPLAFEELLAQGELTDAVAEEKND